MRVPRLPCRGACACTEYPEYPEYSGCSVDSGAGARQVFLHTDMLDTLELCRPAPGVGGSEPTGQADVDGLGLECMHMSQEMYQDIQAGIICLSDWRFSRGTPRLPRARAAARAKPGCALGRVSYSRACPCAL